MTPSAPPPDHGWHPVELVLVGPPAEIARFRDQAKGPAGIPWTLDGEHQRQELMARLVAETRGEPLPRHAADLLQAIGLAQEARHARLVAAVAAPGGGCALDLNRLLPIPADLLGVGPDHPDSLLWLDRHWGTRDAVRHVTLHEMRDPRQRRCRRLRYRFWMLDPRPDVLAAALGLRWPALTVEATALALADG